MVYNIITLISIAFFLYFFLRNCKTDITKQLECREERIERFIKDILEINELIKKENDLHFQLLRKENGDLFVSQLKIISQKLADNDNNRKPN